MPLELVGIEIARAQRAAGIAPGLVGELFRGRVAALATRRHRPGAQARAELDHRDEAVAAGAVIVLRVWICVCAERGEAAPLRRGEGHRDAWAGVVEMGGDRIVVLL